MSAENESNVSPELAASSTRQESAEQLKEIARRAETPPELKGYTTGEFEDWFIEQGDSEIDDAREVFFEDMRELEGDEEGGE